MTDADILKAAIAAAGLTHRPPPIETVTEENGAAVFRNKAGSVIGGMNWDDYQALLAEQKARKAGR